MYGYFFWFGRVSSELKEKKKEKWALACLSQGKRQRDEEEATMPEQKGTKEFSAQNKREKVYKR